MTEQPIDIPPGGQVRLRIQVGDVVKAGDILADIESSKASQELEAFEPFLLRGIRQTPTRPPRIVLLVEE